MTDDQIQTKQEIQTPEYMKIEENHLGEDCKGDYMFYLPMHLKIPEPSKSEKGHGSTRGAAVRISEIRQDVPPSRPLSRKILCDRPTHPPGIVLFLQLLQHLQFWGRQKTMIYASSSLAWTRNMPNMKLCFGTKAWTVWMKL